VTVPASHVSEESIRRHSKSFSLASRVLPPDARRHAVALYAWCRHADDAVDLVAPEGREAALVALASELNDVYAGVTLDDPVLALFQHTIVERSIPRRYAEDLLKGMEMDVRGRRYHTWDELLDYCYHVAGCVGLMMCHAMGMKDEEALVNAAHLGMAMQLTNICRDVEEDWGRDRLYLPDDVLSECGCPGLADRLGEPFPAAEARWPVAAAIERVLREADRYYRSGDAGLPALSWRCAMAIRTARKVYSSIGGRLESVRYDPLAGRAYVPLGRKLVLASVSILAGSLDGPRRVLFDGSRRLVIPKPVLVFPADIPPPREAP
jgi:phytoene synthase